MATEAEPHLKAVPPASAPAAVSEEQSSGSGSWRWLAAIGFLVCAIGWFLAHQANGALEAELAAMKDALAQTERTLELHQAHLAELRTSTAGLAATIQAVAADAEALAARASQEPGTPAVADDEPGSALAEATGLDAPAGSDDATQLP